MAGGDGYGSGARDETPPWTPRNNNQDGFHEVNIFFPSLDAIFSPLLKYGVAVRSYVERDDNLKWIRISAKYR